VSIKFWFLRVFLRKKPAFVSTPLITIWHADYPFHKIREEIHKYQDLKPDNYNGIKKDRPKTYHFIDKDTGDPID